MRYIATLAILTCGCAGEVDIQPNQTATTEEGATNTGTQVTQVAFNVEGAPTVEFNVPKMMCPHGCAPKVHEALSSQPGVKDVKVEYETKTAIVAVDESVFDADAAVGVLEDEYGFANSSLKDPSAAPVEETSDPTIEVEQAEG